jgi:cytochrome c oxidase cbb3-type subunit 3
MRRLVPALLSTTLLLACGEDAEPSEPDPSATQPLDPVARAGEEHYLRYCALCHGQNGEGYAADDAPALRAPEFLRSASDDFLTAAIANGRPGSAMSAWHERHGGPLDSTQIEAIVRYMRTWQQQPRVRVDHIRVRGDGRRGESIYAQQCASCHGARGEGVDAVALANPALLATASDGFLQYAVIHGRTGTRMQPFAGRLTRAQIDDVVTHVRSLGTPETPPEPEQPVELPTLAEMQLVVNPDGPRPRLTLRENRFVPAADVQRELARGARMVIIDARATSDWLQTRIPGAIPVPYYELSSILEDLPRDGTWMIAYCGCPHAASGRVVDALREQGFTNTAVLDEGIHHWEDQGYPVASGPLARGARDVARPRGQNRPEVPSPNAPSAPAAPPEAPPTE